MIGIIHFAYGAPKSIDDIPSYFNHILNGRTIPPAMLEKTIESFKKPGYADFIRASTERIAKGLEIVLNERFDEEVRVYNAYKHTAPFIEETVARMVDEGVTTVVTLPINPIYSKTGSGAFHDQVVSLLEGKQIKVFQLNSWNTHPAIVRVYAERVRRAFNWLPAKVQTSSYVLFTVHSQPVEPERNKLYVQQFEELANAIAAKANIKNYQLTYRSSAGKENWLSPDVKEAIRYLHAKGAEGFVTCELLSLSADLESYNEIGEECQKICQELGTAFAISEFPSDSFDTVYALAEIVEQHLKESIQV